MAIARLNTVIAQKEASFTQKFAQAQHFIFQLTAKLENLEKKVEMNDLFIKKKKKAKKN